MWETDTFISMKLVSNSLKFFFNAFTEFGKFHDKKIFVIKKG